MKSLEIISIAASVLLSFSAQAAVYNVPRDAATIQDAIYLCADGDTVIVQPGIYTGAGNRDISLLGRMITVTSIDPNDAAIVSATVIDCQNSGRGFVFDSGETAESVVAGLTIINGNGGYGGLWGGGLYFEGGSPTVRNCVVVDCSAYFGGAIAVLGGSPAISNCRILGNVATGGGGALYISGADAVFADCIISGNSAPNGGAVYSQNPGSPVLAHCTITSNTATTGGVINCLNGNNLTLYGCILWDNAWDSASLTGSQILVSGRRGVATVNASYCDIQGIDTDIAVFTPGVVNWGLGNIEADPMFIESGRFDEQGAYIEGDFGLLEGSPCIDAGDPDYVAGQDDTDVYGAQRIFGEAVDIGAAEFAVREIETLEARIRFQPRVINLRGKQKWFFCAIRLQGYEAEDIDPAGIVLEDTIKPGWAKKFKRVEDLIVRFDMDEVRGLIDHSQKRITLTVRGTLKDGTPFAGSGTLKVHHKKKKAKNTHAHRHEGKA